MPRLSEIYYYYNDYETGSNKKNVTVRKKVSLAAIRKWYVRDRLRLMIFFQIYLVYIYDG